VRRYLLALLLAWWIPLSAHAATPAWYESWDGIRKAASTIRSIETSFVQTRTLKILTRPLISRGVMAYRRPNDLRWEYQSPLQTLLVVHGGDVQRWIKHGASWVPDASAKLEAMKIVLGEIGLWLDGNFAASRTFKPELRRATTSAPAHVDLVPIDPSLGRIISRIAITFGAQPGTVSAIDIVEDREGVTHIAFENATFNRAIPDERFRAPR
jgi:outer membrane lipoprotein-sorting protein